MKNFDLIPGKPLTRRNFIAGASAVALSSVPAMASFRLPGTIRVGLLGLDGHIGDVLDARRVFPNFQVQAISDKNVQRLKEVGDGIGVPVEHRYTNHQTLLDREKLEVAGICGSDGERAGLVMECIARGLHVIAEKPLGMNWAEVQMIRTALEPGKVHLTMLLTMRFLGTFIAMRQMVESGQIGEVAQVDGQKSYILGKRSDWMRHNATFSGIIPYIGIHLVDLMRFTSKREPTQVSALQAHIGQPNMLDFEDTAATMFRLDNKAPAQLHLDYLRPETFGRHGDDRLRLAGTGGILEYREGLGLIYGSTKQAQKLMNSLPPDQSLVANFLSGIYGVQIVAHPVQLTLDDIFRANQIVFAARDAAESNRIVPIQYVRSA
jgi:predicted dehydrogenase